MFSIAHFSAKEAGDLSTLFDVGGIIGEALSFCSGRLSFLPVPMQRCRKKGQQVMTQAVDPEKKDLLVYSRGWVGLRKTVFVLWFPGVMGAGEGCRESWSFLRPGQHVAG